LNVHSNAVSTLQKYLSTVISTVQKSTSKQKYI